LKHLSARGAIAFMAFSFPLYAQPYPSRPRVPTGKLEDIVT